MARRTLAEYKDAVTHLLGNEPSTGVTSLQIVNDAVKDLCACHGWRWRNGGPYTLSLVADQAYVELPADFGEMNSIFYPGTLIRAMVPTTMAHVERLRAQAVISPQYQYWYAVNVGQIDDSAPEEGLSIPVLELYPTPSESVADALSITYFRDVPELADDADVPMIPSWLDACLFHLVRHKAAVIEDADAGGPDRTEFERLLQQAKLRDGRTTGRLGVMKGGIRPDLDIDPLYPSSISDPSDAADM